MEVSSREKKNIISDVADRTWGKARKTKPRFQSSEVLQFLYEMGIIYLKYFFPQDRTSFSCISRADLVEK